MLSQLCPVTHSENYRAEPWALLRATHRQARQDALNVPSYMTVDMLGKVAMFTTVRQCCYACHVMLGQC